MSKLRAVIISGVIVILSTAIMGGLYVFSNISYSLPDDIEYPATDITINNIEPLTKIDSTLVEGPNLIGDDLDVSVILKPNEEYVFRYDITNATELDYYLSKYIISCASDFDANNYLTITATYENGEQVTEQSNLPKGTRRTVYFTIKYDKNADIERTFFMNIDMAFEMGYIR